MSTVARSALLTPSADDIVARYPDILENCDRLTFDSDAEAVAYFADEFPAGSGVVGDVVAALDGWR